MSIAETTIDGFTVTIEPNDGREGVNCFISKGRYAQSSLALVEDYGSLDPDGIEDIPVKPATIARIRAFAEKHGY